MALVQEVGWEIYCIKSQKKFSLLTKLVYTLPPLHPIVIEPSNIISYIASFKTTEGLPNFTGCHSSAYIRPGTAQNSI
jgi:hypothetical protein